MTDDSAPRAPDLMRLQAEAIVAAAARLDEAAFAKAVSLLLDAPGKVIVSGAGTSGNIARKVAATLTSTGAPALFLHPGDALHGGLGIVSEGDVAVLISNSGETDELLALTPYLTHRSVPFVAIVGNLESRLALQAHVALDAFAAREACPLDLAPTSSTSVALALGDALAMTLMEARQLTRESFAFNHPSGRLGRRLTLTVDAVMKGGPDRPRIAPEANWLELVSAISEGGLGAVAVEGPQEELLGIVTDGDLRRAIQGADRSGLADLSVADIMTPHPVSVVMGSLAYDALRLMEDRPSQINVLSVVDEAGRSVGLVRVHDFVRAGI